MVHECLLAKSWDRKTSPEPPEWAKLVPHLSAVQSAGEAILKATGALILENAGLDEKIWFARLKIALTVAAVLHDIGKANDSFQDIISGRRGSETQPIRHELVLLIILEELDSLKSWVINHFIGFDAETSSTLYMAVLAAVAGHHVKMDHDWKKAAPCMENGGCGSVLNVLVGHPDLRSIWGDISLPARFSIPLLDSPLSERFHRFKKESIRWQKYLKANPEWYRFGAILKALLISADVAGSTLLPDDTPIQDWITGTLCNRLDTLDIENVIHERLGIAVPRDFQKSIGDSDGRVTLVEAGCGTGKTVAAYLWAQKQATGKKLFFCYPTTGTATEGFLGYVADSDVEAQLIHSRAVVDLSAVATASDDEYNEEMVRIASLKGWGPQLVICTADTVLALPRNNRSGLYASPALLSAAFVFDELHAYSDKMFSALLAFVRVLSGARFLFMTASLPPARKQMLLDHVSDLREVPSPVELEMIPRYLPIISAFEECLVTAFDAVRRGKKVLWVANTVARAQAVFDLAVETGVNVATYHSRFKYFDRVTQHRLVIDSFSPSRKAGVLAVTTQVAEMSLDLDADLLISDIAPIPALIQRLGRLNRRVTPEQPGEPRWAYFIYPDKEVPYGKEELKVAVEWLSTLSNNTPVSQKRLTDEFYRLAPPAVEDLDMRVEWLDFGMFAIPGSVREPGLTVQVVMRGDFDLYRGDGAELLKRSLPLNYQKHMDNWPRFKSYLIVPEDGINYDERRGASWR